MTTAASILDDSKTVPTREVRIALLAVALLAALPLLGAMPATIVLLIFSIAAWQFIIIVSERSNPGKLLLMLCVTAVFASIFFSYGHLFGQRPGIALVISMCLLKLFEISNKRDAYIVLYSSCFIIASNFFFNQSAWLALYVCMLIIFTYSILIALSDRLHSTSLLLRLKQSARAFLYALPMMLILFVLFPRIPGPLWGLPEDAFRTQTGLSEEMSPGSINQLISSSAIAFRVRFNNDEIPPHSERYWRGIVLSDYDGKTWRRDDAPKTAQPHIEYRDSERAPGYDYDVTLEPTNLDWLLALEYPQQYDRRYRMTREGVLQAGDKINNVISYRVQSRAAVNRGMFEEEHLKYRLLPVDFNPQTMELARELMFEAGYDRLDVTTADQLSYIRQVLSYFTEQGFIYTLNPDLLGVNAMDDFLLRTRRGFCEHYASAFVYLMRVAGIPARVVVGYQGGSMNPLGDYMIVRQSDAHAWAEVWLGGRWQRFDPTATVSPDRIEQGITNAGLELNQLPALLVTDIDLLRDIAFLYDTFQNRWNQWVIGFDQGRQKRLLEMLGFEQASVALMVTLLTALLAMASLVIGWFVTHSRRRNRDRVQHHYELLCRKLDRKGLRRELNEGPSDFEARVLAQAGLRDNSRRDLAFIFAAYRKLHYGKANSEKLLSDFISRVRRFRLQLR